MNTRLSYRYSDKTNCKQHTSVIVAGTITWEQVKPYLNGQGLFIPGQIGLEDLQHRFALPGQDHPWHQMLPEDFTATTASPTIALDAEELLARFALVVWTPNWRSVPGMAQQANVVAPPQAAPAQPNKYMSTSWTHDSTAQPAVRRARTKKGG